MGGDNAPEAIVNGCIDAANEKEGFDIVLIGDKDKIQKILSDRKYTGKRLQVVHTNEVITNEDTPTLAIKKKRASSMVVGFKMLKERKGDVFLSAGSTGALLAGALLIVGRIKGIDRPAFGVIIPTKAGRTLLIDAGLNSMCKPVNYLQFGILGASYIEQVMGVKNPRVGLINMGTEDKKGNENIRQAYNLLMESGLNFVGNIEGNDMPEGKVEVAVCDGFVGNVVLKFYEGTGKYFFGNLKRIFSRSIFSKLSALIVRKDILGFKKSLDPDEVGGSPILGIDGIVIKSHGNSNAKAIKNVIFRAYNFARSTVLEQLREKFKNTEVSSLEH